MTKRIIIILSLCLYVCFSSAQTVYVCSGSRTGKYHLDKGCRGLANCGSTVKATTVSAMAAQGRTACRICSDELNATGKKKPSRKGKQTTAVAAKAFDTKGLELPITARRRKGQTIKHTGYTTNYNSDWLIPNWVAYDLTRQEVNGKFPRPNRPFEADPKVKGRSAEHGDYSNSGYSRGHMAPAADMKWSEKAMNESFYLSNICPQHEKLNSGVWERLENRCRSLVSEGTVYICCGPIMSSSPGRIGRNGVAVPAKFFKVICMKRKGKWQAVGFVMPNEAVKGSMFDYAMPVDEVEKLTGHNFFPSLPDNVERVIEASWRMQDWQ